MGDLFFIISNIEIASNVDDNMPYIITLMILSNHWKKRSGCLKNNPGECHLLISGNEYEIENSDCEKLLGGNIPDTWKKARGKLQTWTIYRIFKFSRPFVKSVYRGSESVSFLGPKI